MQTDFIEKIKSFYKNGRKAREKALSLLLAIAVLLSATPLITVSVSAAGNTFTAENGDGVQIEYRILDSGSVEVSENSGYSGSITIPARVTDSGTAYSVTAVGDGAFMNCGSLTSITLPASVTSIGEEAFEACGLTNIILPAKVNSIGNFAFYQCISLTSITLPASVTSIGDDAFANCISLTNITLPSKVNSIGKFAFQRCSSLTSITLPASMTSISNGTFADCSSLKSVKLPNSVTSIGKGAFMGCGSLTGITLPDGVTSIGDAAFLLCTNLKSITLPDGVTSIGNEAFCECSSLTSITLPDGVTSIGNAAFYQCSSLTSITLPASVTSIGREAFEECSGLTSITLPAGVTSIDSCAFQGCSSLENAYFDGDIPNIGDYAFSGCSNSLNFHCAGDGDFSELSSYGAVHNKEKTYSITAGPFSHGSVTPSTENGMSGETISLTVKPDEGYALVANSLSYTDSGSRYGITGNSFTMPAANVTVTAVFKKTSGDSSSDHHSSHTSSTTSIPSTVKDPSSGMEVDLSGATFSPNVTGITFSVTPETKDGDPKGESGGITDLDGKAAYNLAVSDADLDIIGTPSLYELKLLDQNSNDISSFSGSVTIKIPLPLGLRGTPRVFRYESDGTLTDMKVTVENGFLVFQTNHFSDYIVAGTGDSVTLDTKSYQMSVNGKYQIGLKLTGKKATSVKFYSTNNGTATVIKLENGNYQVTGKSVGTVWIMFDVYDNKNHLLIHVSTRIDVKTGIRPRGDSTRQIGVY